ncbi:unnamed protein product [Rotaria sordida]|uniref:Uncharacterized protein n=1 Tax=Rotaria sordida TaxID=392033 RepID=A0A814YCI0_9BILA|nr:unnamed protein product [Rotaria sordida]CAF3912189.1 unnamed protein product [Rotaria sordida]
MCGPKQTMYNQGTQLCCRNDSKGGPTIGIGYQLTRNDSEMIMLMYNLTLSNVLNDCQRNTKAIKCADKYVPNLPPMKRNAIIDVAFTSCRALNTFVLMKKALEMNNWTEAAEELRDSSWCSQVRRRRCTENYNCIRKNEFYSTELHSLTTNNSLMNSKCFCYKTLNNTDFCTSKFQCSTFSNCQSCSSLSSICIIDFNCAQIVCVPLSLNGTCTFNSLNQLSTLKTLPRTSEGKMTLFIIFFPLPFILCILIFIYVLRRKI